MNYSIFGATGFVGNEFASYLKSQKKKITLIDRDSRLPTSADSVYFISTTDNYNVFTDIHKDIDVNLTILVDVLKNLKPGSTFNFISSWFVYGETELPANEESYCRPKGFYSITKKCAEDLIISYCETFKINYRILRLCNVYGTGDKNASKKKNALQYLVNQLKNHGPVELYYAGEFYRDYMHVYDAARAIDLVIQNSPKNQIYNIGTAEKIKFKDLINQAIKLTNSKSIITNITPPEFHQTIQVKDFYMNCDKLQSLGFKPMISLEKGIELLCHNLPYQI